MLVNESSTRNWTAVSAIDVQQGTGVPVMYMNAVHNGKDLNFSQNIQNFALYKENKEEVDLDYENFKANVIKEIG